MNENLKNLSQLANEILKSEKQSSIDENKLNLLFPFFEEVLGYDTTSVGDIVIAPAYTSDGEFKIDYGLRGEKSGTYKSCVTVVERGIDLNSTHEKIKECLSMVDTEFFLVTDCFDYQFLVYDKNKEELIEIGKYSILNYEEHDQNMITLIKSPPKSHLRQDYAVDSEEEANEYNQYINQNEEESNYVKLKNNEIDNYDKNRRYKKEEKSKLNKMIFIIPIVVIILFIILLLLFDNRDSIRDAFSNVPIIGGESTLNKNELDGKITALIDESDNTLNINFKTSNIPPGGLVKFEVSSGEYNDYFYAEVRPDGTLSYKYEIPSTWDYPEILIIASLRFDENNHPQPVSVKDKFGDLGEDIILKEGAPNRYSITFLKLEYDSEAVRARLEEEERLKEENEKAQRIEKLSNFEIRVDNFGNWKILPKRFDMDSVNIGENRRVYPQIFYDNEEEQAYFYMVAGTISQLHLIKFTNVLFYADGYEWGYEVNTNTKKLSVAGGVGREWVYFHHLNIPTLISDSELLAKSMTSKIIFKGDKVKEYPLTQNEKKDFLEMIEIFNLYFNTLSGPNPEWYEEVKEYNSN